MNTLKSCCYGRPRTLMDALWMQQAVPDVGLETGLLAVAYCDAACESAGTPKTALPKKEKKLATRKKNLPRDMMVFS